MEWTEQELGRGVEGCGGIVERVWRGHGRIIEEKWGVWQGIERLWKGCSLTQGWDFFFFYCPLANSIFFSHCNLIFEFGPAILHLGMFGASLCVAGIKYPVAARSPCHLFLHLASASRLTL